MTIASDGRGTDQTRVAGVFDRSPVPPIVRGAHGRFIATQCPDPACEGVLRAGMSWGDRRLWYCDGLTCDLGDDTSALVACKRQEAR